MIEESFERFDSGLTIGERRKGLFDFLDLAGRENVHVLPVPRKPFEKVIALHVAVIIRSGNVWRIEIDEIESTRIDFEHTAMNGSIAAAIVERRVVIDPDLFQKMLLQG
jgi:hypothetical protein